MILRTKGDPSAIEAIGASRSLARCGVSLLRAKHAVESVISEGEAVLQLTTVVSRMDLSADLESVGLQVEFFRCRPRPESKNASGKWVRNVRASAGLTQEQFAIVYGIDLKTLRKYEQGESMPAVSVLSYLQMIETDPRAVKRMRIEH